MAALTVIWISSMFSSPPSKANGREKSAASHLSHVICRFCSGITPNYVSAHHLHCTCPALRQDGKWKNKPKKKMSWSPPLTPSPMP